MRSISFVTSWNEIHNFPNTSITINDQVVALAVPFREGMKEVHDSLQNVGNYREYIVEELRKRNLEEDEIEAIINFLTQPDNFTAFEGYTPKKNVNNFEITFTL